MSRKYIITVDTESFEPFHASHKNWENGTRNDFMYAINGKTFTEKSVEALENRLKNMLGYGLDEKYYNDDFKRWRDKSYITFTDRMCGCNRTEKVGIYGMGQGYINVTSHIDEMRKTGHSEIDFSEAYDIRQNYKNYKGCKIRIELQ